VAIFPSGRNRERSLAVACDYRRILVDKDKPSQLERKITTYRRPVRPDVRVQADVPDRIQTMMIPWTQFPLANELYLTKRKYLEHNHQFSRA